MKNKCEMCKKSEVSTPEGLCEDCFKEEKKFWSKMNKWKIVNIVAEELLDGKKE